MKPQDSELAWKLQDCLDHDEEVTSRLRSHPDKSEGELMSDEEVEAYIEEGMRVLYIMSDHGSKVYLRCREDFFNDLSYLASIGRLSREDYDEITKPENYEA